MAVLKRQYEGLAAKVGADQHLLLCNQKAAAVHPCPDGIWRPPEGLPGPGPYRFAHAEPRTAARARRCAGRA